MDIAGCVGVHLGLRTRDLRAETDGAQDGIVGLGAQAVLPALAIMEQQQRGGEGLDARAAVDLGQSEAARDHGNAFADIDADRLRAEVAGQALVADLCRDHVRTLGTQVEEVVEVQLDLAAFAGAKDEVCHRVHAAAGRTHLLALRALDDEA